MLLHRVCLNAWLPESLFSAFNEALLLCVCLSGQPSEWVGPNLFLELTGVAQFVVSAGGPTLVRICYCTVSV